MNETLPEKAHRELREAASQYFGEDAWLSVDVSGWWEGSIEATLTMLDEQGVEPHHLNTLEG